MKIHEYQAKEILRRYGIAIPAGRLAVSVDEAAAVAEELSPPIAVKAQIHAGGRGKGGGVCLAADRAEAAAVARRMLGMTLITPQTGPAGRRVTKLLLEEGVAIARELYCSLSIDRRSAAVMLMTSGAGGMDIEAAAAAPGTVARVAIDPLIGLKPYHLLAATASLGCDAECRRRVATVIEQCYRAFVELDCRLLEINPLVVTTDGMVLALDAKIEFDDNGLFRHPDIAALRDPDEYSPQENEAARYNLSYIGLDGTIGSMVNGAGLAMATMDIIKQAGAAPANFLDVGGGASAEMVAHGLRIILADSRVEGVFINIFGGILRCDVLARGVVEAVRTVGVTVPIVVRLEGTNVTEGRRILAESGLSLQVAADLKDAVARIGAIAAGSAEASEGMTGAGRGGEETGDAR